MKKLLLMFMCLQLTNLKAQDCTKYDLALKACDNYTHALEDELRLKNSSIDLLNKQNKELLGRIESDSGHIPAWAWVLLGAVGGVTLYGIKK